MGSEVALLSYSHKLLLELGLLCYSLFYLEFEFCFSLCANVFIVLESSVECFQFHHLFYSNGIFNYVCGWILCGQIRSTVNKRYCSLVHLNCTPCESCCGLWYLFHSQLVLYWHLNIKLDQIHSQFCACLSTIKPACRYQWLLG